MEWQQRNTYLRGAWVWLAVCFGLRVIFSGAFSLVPDEANYWQWSRHLAWGYHDQAPMIAWLIRLSTSFFGHTELAVRFPSLLAMAFVSAYLLRIAARWIDARAAWHTSLLSQSVLLFNVGSLLATPDAVQALGWAGAAYHTARAYEDGSWSQWLKSGAWFGFGMLSKFSMILFLPCALLFGIVSGTHRKRLASVRPYTAVIFGLFLFAPVIRWNAENNWNSIRHVAHIGGIDNALTWNLRFFGEFVATQAGLLTPLVFILVIMGWYGVLNPPPWGKKWIYRFLFFTSFPMVLGFLFLSLHTRIYGNWAGAGYITASILAASFFGRRIKATFRDKGPNWGQRLWPWSLMSAYLITALIFLHAVYPILPVPVKLDRISGEVKGWIELGKKSHELKKEMPRPENTFLFGLHYQEASQLAFYSPGQPMTVSINRWGRPNVYDYWWKDDELTGWDGVGVTYDPVAHLKQLNQIFKQVDPPRPLNIYIESGSDTKRLVKTFYLYRCYGFKGGLRWIPPSTDDVRAIR
ncbi:MAG: glycosyltransferase family 39 protein [Thermodesulfobacteriota bacterium]